MIYQVPFVAHRRILFIVLLCAYLYSTYHLHSLMHNLIHLELRFRSLAPYFWIDTALVLP